MNRLRERIRRVAPIYDVWSSDMTEDVPSYVELAREADGPIVELAVGTGRVAIPVAEQTGKRVLGIDSSPAMLAVAGWFDRRPFDEESRELVWVARKPA